MPPAAPIKITLTPNVEAKIKRHLRGRIDALQRGLKQLHEDKIIRWRKSYQAVPNELIRDFPFYRASNLVVPIIAIHSDTLLARIMSSIFKTHPLWVAKIYGQHDLGEEIREALEDFLVSMGIEPLELDLYRVYHEFMGETIKYGTSVIKAPWITDFEDMIRPSGDGTGQFARVATYDGPRPEKLAFEDFLIPPSAKTLESADIKIHRLRLQKHQLMERRYKKIYAPEKVDHIIKTPDRSYPIYTQQSKEDDLGAKTGKGPGYAEWDVHECWVKMSINGRMVRIIVSYHYRSDTILRGLYNFYPKNIEPFLAARLFLRDDMFHGIGFAERLFSMQEELSTIHNSRRDNQTVANTRVWRVNPDSKLHQGYKIYPSAVIPAEKDEIEPMAHGELGEIAIEEERMTIDLSERLSGVSSPSQGSGAGVTHGRKGVYTAQGTMALIQEGNTRTDLNVTDMRYAHTKLGRIVCALYAHFGAGEERLEQFGEKAELIKHALDAIADGHIGLPVYAATASVNREVEKQNDIMLISVMNRHYEMIASLVSAVSSTMTPEAVKGYLTGVIDASDQLMKQVLRDFGKADVDRLVPKVKTDAGPNGKPPDGASVAQTGGGQAVQ